MTLTIMINTASRENAVALLNNGQVLGERAWPSNADESQTILPKLEELLDQEGKGWNDVQRVVAVTGPGSYTSLRVGITIANAIAWSRKIPIAGVSVFSVWECRIDPVVRGEDHRCVVAAGRDHYWVEGATDRLTEADINALGVSCYGELPEENPLLKSVTRSWGEAMVELDESGKLSFGTSPVEPFYMQAPHITQPKAH